MSTRLPLVAAQPGIWMAERLSTLPGAWSVAHYVELRGNLDPALLGRAIVTGLAQADTLSMRFCEDNGEAWQWSMSTALLPNLTIAICARRAIRTTPRWR